MDSNLKSKICESFNISTLVLEEPPPTIRNRINVLRGIFINCPPPQDSKAYILINYPKDPEWKELGSQELIGNSSDSQLQLNYPTVSRKHCILEKKASKWLLKDLKSANGVYVNGERVKEKHLNHGDIIQVGIAMLVFINNEGCFTPL